MGLAIQRSRLGLIRRPGSDWMISPFPCVERVWGLRTENGKQERVLESLVERVGKYRDLGFHCLVAPDIFFYRKERREEKRFGKDMKTEEKFVYIGIRERERYEVFSCVESVKTFVSLINFLCGHVGVSHNRPILPNLLDL